MGCFLCALAVKAETMKFSGWGNSKKISGKNRPKKAHFLTLFCGF
jgi:hypothetical protein